LIELTSDFPLLNGAMPSGIATLEAGFNEGQIQTFKIKYQILFHIWNGMEIQP
jgi:hypothetical protein